MTPAAFRKVAARNALIASRRPTKETRDELVRCRILLANLLGAWDRYGGTLMSLSGKPASDAAARDYLLERRRSTSETKP